jgi:hypothetical protein
VTRTDCREPLSESEADAHVDTSAVRVRVGTTVNLSNLNLIIVPHLSISGDASLGGGSDDFTFLPNQPPVDWQRSFGGVGGGNLGTALGLQSPILTAHAATFSQLDGKVFDPLLKAAGVSLGGADVREFELRCRMPQLVE